MSDDDDDDDGTSLAYWTQDPEKDCYSQKAPSLSPTTGAIDAIDDKSVTEAENSSAAHFLSTEDDPLLNPWTLRAFFIGTGLSIFGAVLGNFPLPTWMRRGSLLTV